MTMPETTAVAVRKPTHEFEMTVPQNVLDVADDALSANTRAMYTSAWNRWDKWYRVNGYIPIAPESVAAYLIERAESGLKRATIELDRSAIAYGFRVLLGMSDAQNPALHNGVAEVMRGLRRRGAADQDRDGQQQARPLTQSDLAAITATARRPRTARGGHIETDATADARGRTDIALAHILHTAGLRRSEATRAVWGDLSVEADGSGLLAVPFGKTHDEPRLVYLPPATVEALRAMRPDDAQSKWRMFPFTPHTANRRLQAACLAAGLGDGYSGHSGRVGMAQRLVAAGAPTAVIQQQGRWRSHQMIASYARRLDAKAVAQYLE